MESIIDIYSELENKLKLLEHTCIKKVENSIFEEIIWCKKEICENIMREKYKQEAEILQHFLDELYQKKTSLYFFLPY